MREQIVSDRWLRRLMWALVAFNFLLIVIAAGPDSLWNVASLLWCWFVLRSLR